MCCLPLSAAPRRGSAAWCRPPTVLVLEIEIAERLSGGIPHDEARIAVLLDDKAAEDAGLKTFRRVVRFSLPLASVGLGANCVCTRLLVRVMKKEVLAADPH